MLGLTAASVGAGGCGSSFEACSETRTCAPDPAASGGAGGEADTAGDAGESGFGGAGESPGSCDGDETSCAGECVDTSVDVDHCGDCGTACDARATCQAGQCVACPRGQLACDGACVDPLADAAFCGASGRCAAGTRGVTCAPSELCEAGSCVSNDATLKSLTLTPATLSPEFDAHTFAYTASFPFYTQHVMLAAAASSPQAAVSVAGTTLPGGGASLTPTPEEELPSFSVDVRAESGATQSYELSLRRSPVSTTYVKAFNSRAGFRFGHSVAIDGDTVVVGAPSEDGYSQGVDGDETNGGSGAANSGAAYVMFRGANGKWARQAYLKADRSVAHAGFGSAVAIDGDTIAVGAPFLRDEIGDAVGGVFLFARTGTTWRQQAFLQPAAGHITFGSAVALAGDHLIASAPTSGLLGYQAGALYSYTRAGGTWEMDPSLPNPPSSYLSNYSWLGYRLGFSGDRVATSGEQTASVFVMVRSGNSWELEQDISLPGGALSKASVAMSGDTLALSAPGVVHVFTRSGSLWSKQASLSPFHENAEEGFGASLALEGDLLVVGSGCETCRGAFSTFVRDGETWKNGAYVPTAFIDPEDAHGAAVAISGTRIVVGGPGEDGLGKGFNQTGVTNGAINSGAAYIFE